MNWHEVNGMEKVNKWNHFDSVSLGISLGSGIIGGGFLIWIGTLGHSILNELARDFGIALLIAGAIGLTYELFLNGRMHRRTYEAAAGLFFEVDPEIRTGS